MLFQRRNVVKGPAIRCRSRLVRPMKAVGQNGRRQGLLIKIICSSVCARLIRNRRNGIDNGRESKNVRGKGLGVRGENTIYPRLTPHLSQFT